ncbi:MAG: YfbK domain-containing protein [Acidimicrobiales bacterium]
MDTTSTTLIDHVRARTQLTVLRLIAVVVALLLVATACGSDSDTGSTSQRDSETEFAGGDDSSTDDGGLFGAPSDDVETRDGDADESFAPATTAAAAADARAESDDEGELDRTDGSGLFGTVESKEDVAPEPTPSADSRFTDYGIRNFIEADRDPLSTFALDVDTGSFTIGRRYLDEGELPPRDSVRVEEYVNAFDYDYEAPRRGLDVMVDGGPSPFDEDAFLVRIGVQAEVVADRDRQPVALTFVVDTSGSMNTDDRLGLVKESLTLLVEELDRDDTVAIVTYSGNSGILLEPTSIRDRDEILDAIDNMRAGGSTNLQAGLDTGYELARDAFRDDGINRVIVASDGLANAGITNVDRLAARIRDDADDGIGLVTVGYGLRGFNDTTMEQLADQGDGFYAYVDTFDEAERLFRDELTSTLVTAAIDAKVQVEFDDRIVDEYRLIGYENRGVLDQDFRNDDVDAGELGAGHQATALYEIRLARGVDIDDREEIGVVNLRWQDPETGDVVEIDEDIDLRDVEPRWTRTASDFQQATVVAVFAEVLRDSPFADDIDLDDLADEANSLARDIDTDEFDQFVDMIEVASQRA